jgi:hypothetical protein
MSDADKLRRKAELFRRAASQPTEGGRRTDSLLVAMAERLERAIDGAPAPAGTATEEGQGAPRRCRICGCTDERPCAGGCFWVAADLCSNCGASPTGAVRLWASPGRHRR